jgi:hypothetical protein
MRRHCCSICGRAATAAGASVPVSQAVSVRASGQSHQPVARHSASKGQRDALAHIGTNRRDAWGFSERLAPHYILGVRHGMAKGGGGHPKNANSGKSLADFCLAQIFLGLNIQGNNDDGENDDDEI